MQIEQTSAENTQRIFQVTWQLLFQPRAQHFSEKEIEPLALPPAIHIAFAKTEGTFL
ncbi:hypothetical protein CSE899_04927 [Cronobacter sakazakii E899]|nr:hypothetical protein CSE899_04927 [Cronobacter sakazakii E899]